MTATRLHRGRVVILGAGSVSRCLWWLLLQNLDMDWTRFLVVDKVPTVLPGWLAGRGAQFREITFTRDNVHRELAKLAGPGDLVFDLTTCGSPDMADACYQAGAAYISASATEEWGDDPAPTLHDAYDRLLTQATRWGPDGPPVAVDNGANPGGISHMFRAALADRAQWLLSSGKLAPARAALVQQLLDAEDWPALREATDGWVFQCAERDDQIADPPREPGEYVSTWSWRAMYAEAAANAEVGWGGHEADRPAGSRLNGTMLDLGRPAGEMLIWGWTPFGQQLGVPIAHGEGRTLPEAFPGVSVNYSYLTCDANVASNLECRANGWQVPARGRILTARQIRAGGDHLGAAIWGGPIGWWYGSSLTIGKTRELAPGNDDVTPTTLQVAAFLWGTALEVIDGHVKGGLHTPEDLNGRLILATARPCLGEILSQPSTWTPPGPAIGRPERPGWRTWQLTTMLAN